MLKTYPVLEQYASFLDSVGIRLKSGEIPLLFKSAEYLYEGLKDLTFEKENNNIKDDGKGGSSDVMKMDEDGEDEAGHEALLSAVSIDCKFLVLHLLSNLNIDPNAGKNRKAKGNRSLILFLRLFKIIFYFLFLAHCILHAL